MKPKENKRKRVSIRWIFFGYFIILVLIMLVVVWTFRLLFVDSTYQKVRTDIAEKTASDLIDKIESHGNFVATSKAISKNSDTTVILLDGEGLQVHKDVSASYKGYELTAYELMNIRKEALTSKNGKVVRDITLEDDKVLIYAEIIDVGAYLEDVGPINKGKGTIILTCGIAPMDSTIQTINFELLIVSVIMVVLAFISAILLAHHVSKPLVDISNQSSRLAKGDYNVRFSEGGYKEVSELGETLNYTASELGKTDRMRRDLIANVSHDLRTPLTMIRGYVEMMRDLPNEVTEENMNVILKETDYLTKLVKDMLDMSKLDSNVVKFNRTDFDMDALLSEVAERYNAMYKQQGFTFTYEPIGHPVMVNSDKVMITNVLYNLINNAVNHIKDDKHIAITTEMVGDRLKVHVIDHGEGIEESKLATIWDRYYKAERNLKRESAGSGLGLSIVKTVLTKLDSGYGVKSKVDEGSDFYFDIKVLDAKEDVQKVEPPIDNNENQTNQ